MKNVKVSGAILLGFLLIVVVGVVLASVVPTGCYCYEACYYCDWATQKCTIYDGPGGCFCTENPCRLGRLLCCVHQANYSR